MKDLGARWKAVLVLLALSSMFGSQAMHATTSPGQITVNPVSISFGSLRLGATQTHPATLTNSGGSDVTISQATVTGTGFSLSGVSLPLTLAAGQSATINVNFTPPSGGAYSGTIFLVNTASTADPGSHHRKRRYLSSISNTTTVTVPVSGSGVAPGQLSAAPSSIDLGNVQLGSSQTQSTTLTNSGGMSVTISQAVVTGAGFSASGLSLPLTLAAGQSKSFSVTVAPQSARSTNGNVAVASDASNPTLNVPLSGTGVTPGSLTANPLSLGFAGVQVGNSQTLSETLTNSGGSSVTITQATVTGTGFSLSRLSLPLTLAAGQSATFSMAFTPQTGGSSNGSISIASNASNFTLTVPLSGTGVTPGSLTTSPSTLTFGNVQVGNSQTLSETLTNSGGSSLTVSQAPVTGAGFSISGLTLPLTLAAGQSATLNAVFTPQSGGSASGNLSLTSNASNPTLIVPIFGTGVTVGALSPNPSSLSFGTLQVGNSTTKSETLTNFGGSDVTISQANVTGTGFSVSGLNLPLTLIPGQSFTFGVTFAPGSSAGASGSISVLSNASNSNLTVSLSGTGTAAGQLAISPATTLDFGSVVVGTSKSMTAALSATGSSVTVSSGTPSTSEFALSGFSFPFTIAAGQNASFTVIFAPQASGTASASVSFDSNASNSPALQSLTGSGTPPPQHGVDLFWSASTSTVAGYNLYRSAKSGGPYTKINSVLNLSTSYTDNSVQAGQTYDYVTTDVDASGVESGYSNQVQVVIPSP